MAGTDDWSDKEIDLIVAAYFDMLSLERAGAPYNKSEQNRRLQQLTGRSRGSIEFKHQNISAVLVRLGTDWIQGYKPLPNFQNALIAGVSRFLSTSNAFLAPPSSTESRVLSESRTIFLEPPPILTDRASSAPPALERLVRQFDPAARDARNRALGRLGEECILHLEKSRLIACDRSDLAKKVRWISQEDGDGAGFDILSFSSKGHERLIEVKTTVGHKVTPFFITENEYNLSTERPDAFRLIRLYDFNRTPRAFELIPPLREFAVLTPSVYRAEFTN